jgi:hypothetical protein
MGDASGRRAPELYGWFSCGACIWRIETHTRFSFPLGSALSSFANQRNTGDAAWALALQITLHRPQETTDNMMAQIRELSEHYVRVFQARQS